MHKKSMDKTLIMNEEEFKAQNKEAKTEISEKSSTQKPILDKDKLETAKEVLVHGGGHIVGAFAIGLGARMVKTFIDEHSGETAEGASEEATEQPPTALNASENEATPSDTSETPEVTATVEEENDPFDPHTAPMASDGTVTDDMTFNEAFAAARKELGAGGVFEWNGTHYATFYAEEVDENGDPTVDYDTVPYHDLEVEKDDPEDVVTGEIADDQEDIVSGQVLTEDDSLEGDVVAGEIAHEGDMDADEGMVGIIEDDSNEFDGEVMDDAPIEVTDIDMDAYNDDLNNLEDDFDSYDEWS
ncbi:hypothetical protein [Flammeovirga agarivorans]|uniref:Uncharacterized protein n=1 Tax=Flammeovirga agarivorans TaxID=2726742 RepID=A0A7X8XYT7_9BACT|nr:hypothetical protein [Flammeovirga agarivorans]NLR94443.1 hypothetical protein [Flammeovirga agarivorans]